MAPGTAHGRGYYRDDFGKGALAWLQNPSAGTHRHGEGRGVAQAARRRMHHGQWIEAAVACAREGTDIGIFGAAAAALALSPTPLHGSGRAAIRSRRTVTLPATSPTPLVHAAQDARGGDFHTRARAPPALSWLTGHVPGAARCAPRPSLASKPSGSWRLAPAPSVARAVRPGTRAAAKVTERNARLRPPLPRGPTTSRGPTPPATRCPQPPAPSSSRTPPPRSCEGEGGRGG